MAVEVPQRKGDPVVFDRDEGMRPDTSVEALAALKPAFTPDGTVTAGNASQISDGAAAVVVMSEEAAERLGLRPIAVDRGVRHGGGRVLVAADRAGARDRGGVEAGRAWTPATWGWSRSTRRSPRWPSTPSRMLGIGEDIVNVNGGAIALGHPIGASGARLVLTLAMEMRRRGVDLGAAALCGGGGQGDALIIRRVV